MEEDRINVDLSLETPKVQPEPPPDSVLANPTVKLIALGALVLGLLIPVFSVLDLVRERQNRALDVRREIAATWGDAQTVGALVLVLQYRVEEAGGPAVRTAFFLPEASTWRASMEPEVRRRGIFEVPVYRSRLAAQGRFEALDFAPLGIDPATVLWERSKVRLAVSDLRGIEEKPVVDWAGESVPFVPATPGSGGWVLPRLSKSGLEAHVGTAARGLLTGAADFRLDLLLRGTETLRFLPLGEETTVEVQSPWPDPGFDGAFLPQQREVGSGGFRARWNVTYFGRGVPQSWRGSPAAAADSVNAARDGLHSHDSAFGVTLVRPANEYQQTERSAKYAALFIVLTFTTLFLLELLSPVRLHPMHYLLVGFALCLFYVLLLALGEHIGFLPSYLVAATAVIGLVTAYARSLLGGWGRAAPLAGTLGTLYGYLYVLLQAEDYAVLLGATGLFTILALVMYLTRRLDWWTLRFRLGETG